MTPFKNYTPTQKMIEIVSMSVNKILKEKTRINCSERIDICIDVCDEILRIIENKTLKNGDKNASK